MTLKEFRKQTKDWDENLELFMGERLSEFKYGLINSIDLKKINFMDEPNGEPLARTKVIVLTED